MTTGRWATFDCYGTLVDWLGGMRAALEEIAPAHAERLLSAYHELEPAVQGEHFRRYRDVLAETLRRAADREGVALSPEEEHVLAETLPRWPCLRTWSRRSTTSARPAGAWPSSRTSTMT